MSKAISNTSPLLYLYRGGIIEWLPALFNEIWTPKAVEKELRAGKLKGYNVPIIDNYSWLQIVNPSTLPIEWLSLDLGIGELETMALALENPNCIVLLDDALARRIAQAAGLEVWGTLRILLEAKSQGLTNSIQPLVDKLENSGMWISKDIRYRVLRLAGE